MSFFIDFLAEITGVSDQPRYNGWVQDLERKVSRVDVLLESLMGKQDRSIQELLRQINPSLKEINSDLGLEDFAGDNRSVSVMQEARVFLLNLWHKILLLLDKLEEARTQALFLDTIHRISIRSEFDCIHLALNEQGRPSCTTECVSSFRRYRQLLISTHSFVTIKLAESKPVPSNNSAFFMLESIMIYSKILAANFFRIPEVGQAIIETLSLENNPNYSLKSYEENHHKTPSNSKPKYPKSLKKTTRSTFNITTPSKTTPASTATTPQPESNNNNIDSQPPASTTNESTVPVNNNSTEGLNHPGAQISTEKDLVNFFKEAAEEMLETADDVPVLPQSINEKGEATTPSRENLYSQINNNTTENTHQQQPPTPVVGHGILKTPNTTAATPAFSKHSARINEINTRIKNEGGISLESVINILDEADDDEEEEEISETEIMSEVIRITTEENKLYEIHEESLEIFADPDFQRDYPRLFSWGQFHTALSQLGTLSDNLEVSENPGWTNWLTTKSVLLPFLVRDWVEYIKRVIMTNDFIISPGKNTVSIIIHTASPLSRFHWEKVRGYPQMIKAFLQVLQQIPKFTMPLMDVSVIMLNCNSLLINYYNRIILSRTMLFNISQVLESLLQIQTFFHQFKKMNRPLPANFDLPYLCSALDAVINSDHHQLIQRFLQLIFDISDIFTGELRKQFLSEYLLKKYFFNLFLHWDEVSRNYFHQLLLWKFVRMRSSLVQGNLEEYPFIGKEKDNSFSYIDPEVEYNNDLLMFGKIQCYIHLIQAQTKEGTESAFFEKNLQIYVNRALSEFQFFVSRYSTWEKSDDKDWKLLPLSLLEGKRLSPF